VEGGAENAGQAMENTGRGKENARGI